MFDHNLTIIDDVTGLDVGEIRGNELLIFGRGVTICASREEAIEKARLFLLEDCVVKPTATEKLKSNQINLF